MKPHEATVTVTTAIRDNESETSREEQPELPEQSTDSHEYGLDLEVVKQLQHSDPQYSDMIKYLSDDTLPEDPRKRKDILLQSLFYYLNNEILFHIWDKRRHRGQQQSIVPQLVIPSDLVTAVLELIHDSPLCGMHHGHNRTLEKARLEFFWPSLNHDVIHWVQTCNKCQQKKAPKVPTKAKITPSNVPSQPFERFSTDILGPLKPSKIKQQVCYSVYMLSHKIHGASCCA